MAKNLPMLTLEQRAAQLPNRAARARAVHLLAPMLHADRPLEAVVALLTVADVYPKSRAHRERLGRAVLGNGQTVDDLATAVALWLEHNRGGPWIAATLSDPTAPMRHAARRVFRVLVGEIDELVLERVRALVGRIAGAIWRVENVTPPSDGELADRACCHRLQSRAVALLDELEVPRSVLDTSSNPAMRTGELVQLLVDSLRNEAHRLTVRQALELEQILREGLPWLRNRPQPMTNR